MGRSPAEMYEKIDLFNRSGVEGMQLAKEQLLPSQQTMDHEELKKQTQRYLFLEERYRQLVGGELPSAQQRGVGSGSCLS